MDPFAGVKAKLAPVTAWPGPTLYGWVAVAYPDADTVTWYVPSVRLLRV